MRDESHSADAGAAVGPGVVAACALSAVPGIGPATLARLVATFGTLDDAMAAGPRRILAEAQTLELVRSARDYLVRDPALEELGLWAVASAKRVGARIVLLGDAAYPELLRGIDNAPALLYVRGVLEPAAQRVAVVGSRKADPAGLEIARKLGEGLARAGVEVVSGGARGVDAAAHAGALWGAGTTVAVLGSGIDVVYPPEHGELFERLSRGGGAVISELLPGTQPGPGNFPRRNRIISGLSSAVVVVRAAAGSGALDTAGHARRQGRPLFAVPGEAGARLSAGTREMLRLEVAREATDARDVLVALGWKVPTGLPPRAQSVDLALPRPLSPQETGPAIGRPQILPTAPALEGASLRLWQALDLRLPLHVDELAAKARLTAQETLRGLASLELNGLCTQRPGKYFLRREA